VGVAKETKTSLFILPSTGKEISSFNKTVIALAERLNSHLNAMHMDMKFIFTRKKTKE
jgi:hypothetical protein